MFGISEKKATPPTNSKTYSQMEPMLAEKMKKNNN